VPQAAPAPARPPALPAPRTPKPHPGLAVVAVDGAAAGAGGRLEDLVRGREDVAIDPCGGPGRNLLSVSGIVPDGVSAAFLTSPDGTAVRADVTGNAYAFVVAPAKTAEQRYVVWTGGDGTPHVQQVALGGLPARICTRLATRRVKDLIQLTPGPGGVLAAQAAGLARVIAGRPPVPRRVTPARAPKRP
jgi:hypothetical protein